MNRKYYFNNMWWGWVTGNVTQLIVIDNYYHAVVMLSCISTLTKVQKKGKLADEQKILF
ncbi:Colicin-Ia immunity protein [Shigella sonnei]|nr:Colicin-Ia immunity protein [Shigella sonnei]